MRERWGHPIGRGRLAALAGVVAAAILAVAPAHGQGSPPANDPAPANTPDARNTVPAVLIIASYERTQTTTRAQEDAARAEIERAFPFARIRSDYIVSALAREETPNDELLAAFANTLRVQHGKSRYDLIISIDSLALQVLSGPGRDMIAGTPLVYTGVTLDRADVDRLGLNGTGVLERIDPAGTLDLALALHPDTRHVAVVSSGSIRAQSFRELAEPLLEPFGKRVEIVWTRSATTPGLLDEVKALGPNTIVLYLAFTDSASGVWDSRGLRVDWPVPAYGVFASNLRLGLVGGVVVDPTAQGSVAGQMAVRVLEGTPPKSIDPCVACTNAPEVRDPMLDRWDIPKSRLPRGTRILEPVPGWLERHREVVLWTSIACVIQAGVIALLLVNRTARRLAETDAQTHSGLLELITDTVPVYMSYVDAEERYRWVNRRYEEWFGRPRRQIVGASLRELHSPEAYESMAPHVQRALAGERVEYSTRVKGPDGKELVFEAVYLPRIDAKGARLGFFALVTDATDRDIASSALRDAQERYARAIRGSNDGIWDWDLLTDQVYWSPHMSELLGLPPAALELHRPERATIVHPDDVQTNLEARRLHIETGTPYDVQIRLRVQGKGYRWFRVRGVATRDASGKAVRMAGSMSDVHDSVLATESLRESEERYRQIFHTNQAVKLVLDADDGRIVDANEAAAAFYGYPLDTLLRMSIHDINTLPSGEVDRRIGDASRGRLRYEFVHRTASGELRDVEVHTGPFNFHGRTLLFSIVHDLTDAARARRALAESEAKYRRIVETAAEGIWLVDATWHTTFVNPRMADMLGYRPEKMVGRHLYDFMDDRARTECERNMLRREDGLAEQHDFRLRHRDGHDVWTTMATNPLLGERGEFIGALAMVTDVTERRAAQAAMQDTQKRFRATFEHAAVGIANVDLHGRWLAVNDRMCQIVGRSREELLGGAFIDITHPDDVTENLRLTRASLAGAGDVYAMDKRYIRPDGSTVWCHVTASLVRDSGGSPEYFVSVVQDISDRKHAESELADSRRLLERAQQVGRIGSWVSQVAGGDRLEWSPEVFRIFGVDESAFGHTTADFFRYVHPDDRNAVQEAVARSLDGGSYSIDHRIVRPDGSVRWVHEDAQIERDADGAPLRMIGVVQDITDRVEAQRFSDRQRQILEMMASGAPLKDTIEAVVRLVEQQADGNAIASVLRLDERGKMWTVSAPGLASEFSACVDGAAIGPSVGSCGTAMHAKRRVVVEDIANDPLWAAFKDAALKQGLRACWSEPILASDGSVLGSLAMYFKEVRRPGGRDLSTITVAAHLAGIAMERARNEEARRRSEAAYRALLEAIPDMMFRVDRAGTYLDYHAPTPGRLMVPPERFLGRTVRDVLPRDRAEQCMAALDLMFESGDSQLYEYEVRRADGTAAWWEVRVVRARPDEALLLLRDVTERREAESRLRDSEQRLRLLVQGTPLAVISWNMDFTVAGWNPGAARIFGHSEDEALGQHARFIVPESAREGVEVVWRELLANRGGFRTTNQNVRRSGEIIYCDWYNAPLVDGAGRVIGVASLVEDVTERRLAQQRTDFMMAELDHRVKNNLAAVISLAEQTGRGSSDYHEFLDTFMGRLRAMSRMHSILARSRWQGADLRTLVTQTLEAFGSDTFGRASVEGPNAMLLPRAAQAIAMALNELATNAVKYGALSTTGGHVAVQWTIVDGAAGPPRRLRFRWRESGGPPVSPPERRGFGSELIEGAIAYELRGTARLSFLPEGVVCDIDVPYLTEVESHVPGIPTSPIEPLRGIPGIDSGPVI